jgi:fatty acid desaturase
MPKPRRRKPRPELLKDPIAFPTLLVLVAAVVALGFFEYWLLLVLGSAIFVGFFGWRGWRRAARAGSKR